MDSILGVAAGIAAWQLHCLRASDGNLGSGEGTPGDLDIPFEFLIARSLCKPSEVIGGSKSIGSAGSKGSATRDPQADSLHLAGDEDEEPDTA